MRVILLLSIMVAAMVSAQGGVADSYEFNAYWESNYNNNAFQLYCSIENIGGVKNFHFELQHARIQPPGKSLSVYSECFLTDWETIGDSSQCSTAANIGDFDPARDTITKNVGGSSVQLVRFKQNIPVGDFDDLNTYPCHQQPDRTIGGVVYLAKRCTGFVGISFTTHPNYPSSTSRENLMRFYCEYSSVKANFYLTLLIQKVNREEVKVEIKTKVVGLPCQNCATCPYTCVVSASFQLHYQLCKKGELAADNYNCKEKRANSVFTYGYDMFPLFQLVPPTRDIELRYWEVQSEYEQDQNMWTDFSSYIDDMSNHEQLVPKPAPVHLAKIPAAGPANAAGTSQLNMRFTFFVAFHQDATVRRTLSAEDRFLQVNQNSAREAVSSTVSNVRMNDPAKAIFDGEKVPSLRTAPLDKAYTYVVAALAVVCVACVCATTTNLLSLFRKPTSSGPEMVKNI